MKKKTDIFYICHSGFPRQSLFPSVVYKSYAEYTAWFLVSSFMLHG